MIIKYDIYTHIFADKNAKATFSKNISLYAIFNDQRFNDTLTNDMVSFEQLGPGCSLVYLGCS